jgi:hypothetical protein
MRQDFVLYKSISFLEKNGNEEKGKNISDLSTKHGMPADLFYSISKNNIKNYDRKR